MDNGSFHRRRRRLFSSGYILCTLGHVESFQGVESCVDGAKVLEGVVILQSKL